MKQEQKELLLKDLCSRLPYGVYVEHIRTGIRGHLHDLKVYPLYDKTDDHIYDYISSTDFLGDGDYFDIEWFKPLLFPLSSMTEELREEHKDLLDNDGYRLDANDNVFTLQDFYCKYHIDYRGLIPMGLAIDCTNLNIY